MPLSGIVFRIKGTSTVGKEVDVLTEPTDANGKTSYAELPVGNYTITEENVPLGYYESEPKENIEVQKDDVTRVNIINEVQIQNKKGEAKTVHKYPEKTSRFAEKGRKSSSAYVGRHEKR